MCSIGILTSSSYTAAVLTCGQIVSILRESNGGDGARVAREVGHIGTLLQIPDLDLRISSSSSKNETIRVELCTGESCREQKKSLAPRSGLQLYRMPTKWVDIKGVTAASTFISDFGEDSTSLDVRKCPVLQKSEEIKERLVWWYTEWVKRSFITKCYIKRYLSSCGHTPDPQKSWAGSPQWHAGTVQWHLPRGHAPPGHSCPRWRTTHGWCCQEMQRRPQTRGVKTEKQELTLSRKKKLYYGLMSRWCTKHKSLPGMDGRWQRWPSWCDL